ncbi:Mur ligase [Boeremia exigua]|uniref:Mur ligase n=1 Tax=Boeremia exigua TaxID=749465 RepID=UPI001E8D0FC0|nr:Mur ligase [Boeremia exigua]KAH6639713.1 Mur ligase [Boeremia exigua]
MAGIQPGLTRVAALLKGVEFRWKAIHVAGTNGKGSVCHYASSILVGMSRNVGRFTSPHLVDRWDCITLGGKPVSEHKFRAVEAHYLAANRKHHIGASPFEILTATAFTIFNDAKIDIGIVEVGMGGKLDSTNILNNQAVSVITKIARDHEGFLGSTLSQIASHKAGILRPNTPYIISPDNEVNVQAVIEQHAQKIGAGPQLLNTSFNFPQTLYGLAKWARITQGLQPFQITNLQLAVVAAMQVLQTTESKTPKPNELAKTLLANKIRQFPGRQEMVKVTPVFRHSTQLRNHVLVDGAHNTDAAVALDTIVQATMRYGSTPAKERPESGWPVTWVLAMTEGKDARSYLATLLKPGDKVVTTAFGPVDGMPWVKPMDPKELLEIAKSVQPQITGVHVPIVGALRALSTAKYMSDQVAAWSPIVLTGSLYLVGDLHRELRLLAYDWWTSTEQDVVADRESFMKIQAEERERVTVLRSKTATNEQTKLQEQLDALDSEVEVLKIQETRITKERSVELDMIDNDPTLSAADRLERIDQRFVELHATPEELAAYMVRAEKTAGNLARYQAAMEVAAKERAAKAEIKQKRKDRIEERKERKAERKARDEMLLGGKQRRGKYSGSEEGGPKISKYLMGEENGPVRISKRRVKDESNPVRIVKHYYKPTIGLAAIPELLRTKAWKAGDERDASNAIRHYGPREHGEDGKPTR